MEGNNNDNNKFDDLEWIVSEEINKCDGCSGSCFLRELIEEQRKGLITEEEIVENRYAKFRNMGEFKEV